MQNKIIKQLRKLTRTVFNIDLIPYEKPDRYYDCAVTIKKLLIHYQPTHVCDIGSNEGFWSNTLSRYCSTVEHFCLFEPQQSCQESLHTISLGKANRKIFNLALGKQKGEMILIGGTHSASILGFNEKFKTEYNPVLNESSESVTIATLDGIYEENGDIPSPDLIKLDVQGFELPVMLGGKEIFNKAKCVVIELSMEEYYKGQDRIDEIIKFLYDMGYVIYDFGMEWRIDYKPINRLLQIDAIFIKR